jgi:hypothetical protein
MGGHSRPSSGRNRVMLVLVVLAVLGPGGDDNTGLACDMSALARHYLRGVKDEAMAIRRPVRCASRLRAARTLYSRARKDNRLELRFLKNG